MSFPSLSQISVGISYDSMAMFVRTAMECPLRKISGQPATPGVQTAPKPYDKALETGLVMSPKMEDVHWTGGFPK